MDNTKKALEKFGKYLVKESRKNLTRKKKNVTSSLYDSLDYQVKAMPNSFEFDFLMEEYGEWVDKGRGHTIKNKWKHWMLSLEE